MTEKDAQRNPHPPYCTCVDCVQRRLQRQQQGSIWKHIIDWVMRKK